MAPSSYFADNYGEKLTNALNALRVFSDKCWKKAAVIIGLALAGYDLVPGPADLGIDIFMSIGDALGKCEIDNYLLVNNYIPPLIQQLIINYLHFLTTTFIDKYSEAVNEIKRILDIARERGDIYFIEIAYALGLVSIIARARQLGKAVDSSDADAVLYIASLAMQFVKSPTLITPILVTLLPLRDKAPHRYIDLLASTSSMEGLNSDVVKYILNELNDVLEYHDDRIKKHAWSLAHAIRAYTYLFVTYRKYFTTDEIKRVVNKVINLLNELGKSGSNLGVIAWAYALTLALMDETVRMSIEDVIGINVVNKAGEVLEELSKLRKKVKELMKDEEFMSFAESMYIRTDEEKVKETILDIALTLKQALAHRRFYNDELDEAAKLFNEVAKERWKNNDFKSYEYYLYNLNWALRAKAIKGSLVGGKLVGEFKWLYKETSSVRRYKSGITPVGWAHHLSITSNILGGYLVSLALANDDKAISELLRDLPSDTDKGVLVPTKLTLNALLNPRGRLSGELEGKLSVNPEELIETLNYYGVGPEFLPALMVAFGIAKPEDVSRMCMSINDSTKGGICMYAISVAMNDNAAVVQLRERLIDTFRGLLFEKLGLLKELGVDADKLIDEFKGLADGLDGKSLAQLLAPGNSMAQFVLMLHALVNGNEKLAKALALMGVAYATDKLFTRLFLEAYKACCDLGSESFRRAIAKLFFYHV
jgi:hypothetical protein